MGFLSGCFYKICSSKATPSVEVYAVDSCSLKGWNFCGGHSQQWVMIGSDHGCRIKNISTGMYISVVGDCTNNARLVTCAQPFEWHLTRDACTNGLQLCVPQPGVSGSYLVKAAHCDSTVVMKTKSNCDPVVVKTNGCDTATPVIKLSPVSEAGVNAKCCTTKL